MASVLQGLLLDGKEGKRRLDRKMSEYDAARLKHLGHKSNPKPSKWRKGEDADKIHSDMVAAQVCNFLLGTCLCSGTRLFATSLQGLVLLLFSKLSFKPRRHSV